MPATVPIDKYDAPLQNHERGPHKFHLMAKPGGCACNLDCRYCFYLSKSALPDGPKPGRMSDATLETFVRKYLEAITGDQVIISWQGGEPSLLGLPFYRKVIEYQKRNAKPGLPWLPTFDDNASDLNVNFPSGLRKLAALSLRTT